MSVWSTLACVIVLGLGSVGGMKERSKAWPWGWTQEAHDLKWAYQKNLPCLHHLSTTCRQNWADHQDQTCSTCVCSCSGKNKKSKCKKWYPPHYIQAPLSQIFCLLHATVTWMKLWLLNWYQSVSLLVNIRISISSWGKLVHEDLSASHHFFSFPPLYFLSLILQLNYPRKVVSIKVLLQPPVTLNQSQVV